MQNQQAVHRSISWQKLQVSFFVLYIIMTQFLSVKENIRKAQMKFSYVQTFKFRRYQMLISRYCFSHIKKKKRNQVLKARNLSSSACLWQFKNPKTSKSCRQVFPMGAGRSRELYLRPLIVFSTHE